jgi:hypothetical protein
MIKKGEKAPEKGRLTSLCQVARKLAYLRG